MPDTWRQRLGAWIAGRRKPAAGARTYASARPGRSITGYGTSGYSSADAELLTSLVRMRAASRQMVRDSAHAKRARQIVVNNVVGSGVGFEAQVTSTRNTPLLTTNAAIEEQFCEWSCAESAHVGGALHFHDFERACMGQVFEAGEVFVRMHYRRMGRSKVPLALELIESERVPETILPGPAAAGNDVRMGVEIDEFGRAVAYWVRMKHPGDVRFVANQGEKYERVPAEEMLHLRVVSRWPQTRGEPWMHAVLRKVDDLNELSAAELQAVRAASYYFGTITTPGGDFKPPDDETGKPVMDIEPLTVQQLADGEQFQFHAPDRPNANLDACMRHIVREMAAGVDVCYGSLSRDYSQSNYSSSRLSLMDDRDTWRQLQQWWVRTFRKPLHCKWVHQAVLAGALPVRVDEYGAQPEKFEAARFKPRGWGWIDPTKEVNAYKEAIKAGLTTLTDVISETANGRSFEDVLATRQRELQMLEDADVDVDTTVEDPAEMAAAAAGGGQPAAEGDGTEADAADAQDEATPPARARIHPLRATA